MRSATAIAVGWRLGPRLSPAGGIRIEGADLSQPLSAEQHGAILEAFHAHHVVVFPGQRLSREQQFAFAANFGEIETHRTPTGDAKRDGVAHILSNLDRHGNPVARFSPAANYHWHTDKPYHAAPPMLTILYAVELPARGGDTEFANMAMAYEALPRETRRRIAGLRVRFAPKFMPAGERREVDHPLVRTHPATGRKSLYLGNHAAGILGLDEAEAAALLAVLLAHATQARFVYAHSWQAGDLAMWDNRCLLHRGLADFDMARERRVMHRSVVRGTVPF
jgi:alpha-ketoglutarate-dependent 2,4-dichlorophenoxyacetate dioxygenase